jgi:hypothetical protein
MRVPSLRDASQHHGRDVEASAAVLHAGAPPSTPHARSCVAGLDDAPDLPGRRGLPCSNLWDLVCGQASRRSHRGLCSSRARPVLTKRDPPRAHPNSATTPASRRGAARSPVHRTPSPVRRSTTRSLAWTASPQHENVTRSRLLTEALLLRGACPSALRDARTADDDFPRSRPTDLAVSCKAAPAATQPAGPGARRRPSTHGHVDLAPKQDVACAASAAPPS